MKVKSVTVGYGLTISLPDYNNVKPSLALTAEVGPEDDIDDVLGVLLDKARMYCEGAADDELEGADQSPRYYEGPLFCLYRWQRRNALVILKENVKTDDLPGSWHRQRSYAQRYDAVLERARREAGQRDVLNLSMSDDLVEVHEWWDAQKWYGAWGLVMWRDRWDSEMARLVCVREGLNVPGGMDPLAQLSGPSIQTLENLLAEIERSGYGELRYDVIDEQEALDKLMGDWMTLHPRDEWEKDHHPDDEELFKDDDDFDVDDE